jgi:hypothetical protein
MQREMRKSLFVKQNNTTPVVKYQENFQSVNVFQTANLLAEKQKLERENEKNNKRISQIENMLNFNK